MKEKNYKKLEKGLPLTIRSGHTIRLEMTKEPLTVHTGLSLQYTMTEALGIPQILDQHIHVKECASGYPESEHILALSANAFVVGDYLDELEALREDVAIQMALRRQHIPDPTAAGDFCECFSLGHILQINEAFGDIHKASKHPDILHSQLSQSHPLGRIGKPEDIAYGARSSPRMKPIGLQGPYYQLTVALQHDNPLY